MPDQAGSRHSALHERNVVGCPRSLFGQTSRYWLPEQSQMSRIRRSPARRASSRRGLTTSGRQAHPLEALCEAGDSGTGPRRPEGRWGRGVPDPARKRITGAHGAGRLQLHAASEPSMSRAHDDAPGPFCCSSAEERWSGRMGCHRSTCRAEGWLREVAIRSKL